MQTTASSEALVVLKGGSVASLKVLQLGWNLEDRGFTLTPENGRLRVRPHEHLTPEDIAAIRRHRDELLALVCYVPPAAPDLQ